MPALWDWRKVASEAKAAMRREPADRAGAIARFATRVNADPGRVAYLVTQADSLERHRRLAAMSRSEVECTPEAAEALRRIEAIAPMAAADMIQGVLRGKTTGVQIAVIEKRIRLRNAPVRHGVECPVVEAASACMARDPRYASATISTSVLSKVATMMGVDAEVVMPNAEPDDDGHIRPRIAHAVFASPQCRASRNAGQRFSDVVQRAYAALAFYDGVHLYAVAAGEIDELSGLEALRKGRRSRIEVTLARDPPAAVGA